MNYKLQTAIAAVLLLAACDPTWASVILPPAQYDHPFAGRKIIEHVPYFEVQSACLTYPSCNDITAKGARIEAFSFCFIDATNNKACHYVYPLVTDMSKDDMDVLIRHEEAHSNGWTEAHEGGHY